VARMDKLPHDPPVLNFSCDSGESFSWIRQYKKLKETNRSLFFGATPRASSSCISTCFFNFKLSCRLEEPICVFLCLLADCLNNDRITGTVVSKRMQL
jgi:hypothetical protein